SKNATPNPNWETFVVTGKARSRIRRFMAQQQRDQFFSLGKAVVAKAFRDAGHQVAEKGFDTALKVLRLKTLEDLYVAVGSGNL
ncbi:RelA/SpoT AH/RIS domain-containing protein, partial [Acinetobacter baumannii]